MLTDFVICGKIIKQCLWCYNGETYYFVKNLQGDIVAIADASNTVVARYSYDAWRKCTIVSDSTAVSIATINPYRYRGYYYDVETGLYYLQSRYYDPEVGRFISGDEAETSAVETICILTNMYVYCLNSPVNSKDNCGNLAEQLIARIIFGSGWKKVSKLQAGDKVKRNDGTLVDVLDVEIVYLKTPVNVYNFEVADWHTYFVGNTSVLVHNMCAKEFVKSPKNAKQVLKYLKEQGFEVVSQNGSYIKLTDGIKTTIVPNHGTKDIAKGTLRSIMKQAGLL